LQIHSEWSDGSASVKEMPEAGEERGYEYIAITDHAQGLKIAGVIDEKQLSEQGIEISAVNDAMKRTGKRIRVLRSNTPTQHPVSPKRAAPNPLPARAKIQFDGSFFVAQKRGSDGAVSGGVAQPFDPHFGAPARAHLQFSVGAYCGMAAGF
jgi:PHP domain